MSELIKIVVTIPESGANKLREIIGDVGGGQIGKYTHCSFSIKGIGRFLPKDGAHPAIGTIGELEEVIEERIEITCERDMLPDLVRIIRTNHPYEEPVIDIYPLLSED